MHFLSTNEREKWIENYVESETTGARKQVQDGEVAISQQQKDTETAEKMGLTPRDPTIVFHKMMSSFGDSLSDIASSNDGENGEVEDDEEREQGQLSKDDEPGWVMGTISKMVQQCMESFWQKQMKLNELPQPGWEVAANYFSQRDKMYSTSELRVLAVVEPQTEENAAAAAPTTYGEPMECLDIVP